MIFGYLDPGSGSLLLQAVIGGLAGLGVAWKAMRMKMSRPKAQPDTDADEPEETTLPAEP